MKADIVRIAQEYDLEQRVTVNFVHMRLPSGRIIRGLVDDASAQAITQDSIRYDQAPQPAIAAVGAPVAAPTVSDEVASVDLPEYTGVDGMPVAVFGGDGPAPPAEYEEAPGFGLPPAPLPPLHRPQPPRPTRKVQADEAGNPIVQSAGGVDPSELIASPIGGGMTAG